MKKIDIVIVENDEDEKEFIAAAFEKSDLFSLLHLFENGDLLLEWLESKPVKLPEAILSDLNMPGKNGYDIINYIKSSELLSYIPVIITSTSSTFSIREKCLEAGAADYMTKPELFIEYEEFIKKLYAKISDLRERNTPHSGKI